MTEKELYLELQDKAAKLADAYYNQDTPAATDEEYDSLMLKIKAIEAKHPEYVTPYSITQVIGGVASSKFSKVEHDVPMLSIEDKFDKESVKEWVNKVKSVHPDATFTVEEKIDGLSCTLRYQYVETPVLGNPDELYQDQYRLVLAETRGNGFIGEDVTENALQVEGVPAVLVLPHDTFGDEFQIRGEIYMKHEDFERYNKAQVAAGKEKAANPRNLAAGTLRQKDAALVKERGLHMFIFRVQKVTNAKLDNLTRTQYDAMQILSKWFDTVLCYHADCFETVNAIIDQFEQHKDGRFGYDIDGAVVKVNEIAYQDDFTGTAKYCAGHIAYKYPQTEKRARLLGVEVGVGRTGKLSFTGIVCDDETGMPLQMCGTEVSRVTLNNMDYIREHHIGIGGVYGIIKSGEIIPKLTDTIFREPEKIYQAPEVCPFCGSRIKDHGSVDVYCSNENCEERAIQQMVYFVGRNQMNIDGLSEETIRYLNTHGYINIYDPSTLYECANDYEFQNDIYADNENETIPLSKQQGWSNKSVKNLVDSINKSRHTTFIRFLASLGISGIGHGQAKLLKAAMIQYVREDDGAKAYYGTKERHVSLMEILFYAYESGYEFIRIEGFGQQLVTNLTGWLERAKMDSYWKNWYGFLFNSLTFDQEEDEFEIDAAAAAEAMRLNGLTFVVTGSFEHYKPRTLLEKEIESFGGKVSGSVSSKTDYLISNDTESNSGKNKKAKEIGVKIISEAEYRKLAGLEA